MSESNLMFLPMIKLLLAIAKQFGDKFGKTIAMTETLLLEMPEYIKKLPVLNEAL